MKCIHLDVLYTFLFEDKWASFDYTNRGSTVQSGENVADGK